MIITDETITYVAALAKLQLLEEEKEKAKDDLNNIIGYMAMMNDLDTEQIEPMSHVLPLNNVFRDDTKINQLDRDNLLANAPAAKDGCFKVPKTVE